jgi:hypothetical protein
MKVVHTAQIEAVAGSSGVTVGQLREFVAALPDEAEVNAIMRDRGTQRDPEEYLHGLTARWES